MTPILMRPTPARAVPYAAPRFEKTTAHATPIHAKKNCEERERGKKKKKEYNVGRCT